MPAIAGTHRNHPPVRGTQSFVGVMSAVWGRPSLTAVELLWRWGIGVPILALVAHATAQILRSVHFDKPALEAITVFQPVKALHVIGLAIAGILPAAQPIAACLLPVCAVAWLLAAAWGRTLVLRRYDPNLQSRPWAVFLLGALRAALLTFVWILWVGLILWAGRVAITEPARHGADPNVVYYCAILICGSLFLYVFWAVCSWPFQLAPLLAMEENIGPLSALRSAISGGGVRSKLVEINLVMNIVKIAVLVLGMVFSASPLPFSSVETQTFLNCWWAGVIALYFAASDYFHVVHAVAYLSLWRELSRSPQAGARNAEEAATAERFTL
jgi:hypothetical protein